MQQTRPGPELCPVVMTAKVSSVDHLLSVLSGTVDEEASFRIGGFIPSPGGILAAESCLAQDDGP